MARTKKEKQINEMVLKNITAENIKRCRTNDRAFQDLLNNNKGFIESIVLKYVRRFDDKFDDLYQIGCISLYKALDKFDPARRNASKFHTFAWTVINNDVLLEVKRSNERNKRETSLEIFRNNNSDANNNSDYKEGKWNNTPTYNMEDTIINKLAREQYLNTFSNLEREIISLKLQKFNLREIAKETGRSIHLIKNVYYRATRKPNFRNIIEI